MAKPSPAICVLFDFAHFVNFNIHQKGFRMKLILIYMQLITAHAPQKKSNWFKYELRRTEGAVVASFKSLLVRFHAAPIFTIADGRMFLSRVTFCMRKAAGIAISIWVIWAQILRIKCDKGLSEVIACSDIHRSKRVADLSKIKAHVLPGICTQIWRCGKISILGQ